MSEMLQFKSIHFIRLIHLVFNLRRKETGNKVCASGRNIIYSMTRPGAANIAT